MDNRLDDLFAYDGNSTLRWGITSSFRSSGSSAFVPDAFMAAVVIGTAGELPDDVDARYDKAGNIFTSASGDIYIYS